MAGAIIAAAAVAAYRNSFSAQFNFDDGPAIVDNPTIRHLRNLGSVLSPPPGGATVSGRPILNLSLAINYAISGTSVWSYHAVNLLIHILAGLTLFGIMRRTFDRWSELPSTRSSAPSNQRVGGNPLHLALAFAIALIWTLHPLQTESVTYIIQRAESLMGLFYLLTLYCFIRSVGAAPPRTAEERDLDVASTFNAIRPFGWGCFAVAACLLGMATKEVMVSAPVIVFLYDRTFVSGTFREAWRKHRALHMGLAATWILLIYLALGAGTRGGTAGVNVGSETVSYWLTQFPAIVHYLSLAIRPAPLILDYGMKLAPSVGSVFPSIVAVGALLAGTAWLLTAKFRISNFEMRNFRAVGFAGFFFFAILAPTSLVPVISQIMAEHRMYLALAPVIAVAVCGGCTLLERVPLRPAARRCGGWIALAAITIVCGSLTARRNDDYRTGLSLWSKTAAESPLNPRVQYNLGLVLANEGNIPAAIQRYREALRLKPDYFEARNNLGIALADTGHWPEAIAEYEEAVRLGPGFSQTHYNLGNAFLHVGKLADAIDSFEEARDLAPDDPNIYYNLGVALTRAGRPAEAIPVYQEAVRLRPDSPQALNDLGYLLAKSGRLPEAIAQFEQAVRFQPGSVEAHDNLGSTLAQTGQVDRAEEEFEAAARLEPNSPEIHNNLGCALAQLGRIPEARRQFEEALRLSPDDADARSNLARLPAPQ